MTQFQRPAAATWAAMQKQTKAKLAKANRAWPMGSKSACPRCAKKTFVGRDDLAVDLPGPNGQILLFRHLQGARCTACDYQVLEAPDQLSVEELAGTTFTSDYEGKVSRIGSGTLGTYWPKDVERVLGLRPQDKAFIRIIGPDAALVRFQHVNADA